MSVENKIKVSVRDILDFPVKGIVFKDVTPLFKDIILFNEITEAFAAHYEGKKIDKIAGVEARGFLFGMALAVKLGVGFVPVRKKGKLPAKTISVDYALEYGTATIEMHEDAISAGENVLIVDDLLATGGTVAAAVKLIKKLGANVVGCAFVIELSFLNGRKALEGIDCFSLSTY
jgi:adenine phosphoribosyltransferase